MESGLNQEVKDLLEFKYKEYNNKSFIEYDPISIPHKFSQKEDIEIIGFLVSIIAWGNRKSIISSGNKLIEILGNSPYDFMFNSILYFRDIFFSINHEKRSEKHISNPKKKSACKRINMYLRWMVRKDKNVDFGIWKSISPSVLSCPLDVHTANSARKLNLISRKQNNIETVIELDKSLRKMDKNDPVKYDFALFSLGAFENF